ncbi:helix-hairpin-helix domain-containing protein [Dyadobacter sp. 32]|uniref:ComEA family DNA-binding protein n=1 Tax=Dyadobacter sp. 32 TaxID=538966 RepID=UPI0011F0842B
MIKRLINQLQNFFGITRKEARASLALMVIGFCLLWLPFIFKRWVLPLIPTASTHMDTKELDSLAAELEKEAEVAEEERTYKKPTYENRPPKAVRLTNFDPNQASMDELEALGIPKFLTKRIEKYRGKGGQFRKKEDLLHIYDFPADLYKRLEPYITLQNSSQKPTNYQRADFKETNKLQVNTDSKELKPYTKTGNTPFDINTTDTTQLNKLKGIGSKRSLRILKFRDALGGFHSEKQFQEIFGLDSLALSELNKYAKVQSPVRKININTATAEELSGHVYLRNKKLAAVIVNYRDQHGPYGSAEDLKKVKVLDEATITKLVPYLSF